MNKKKFFKAYYITHSLLADFQENGGFHSMLAEEDLLDSVLDYIFSENKEKELLDMMDFEFGLTKRNLTKALKGYEKYRKQLY